MSPKTIHRDRQNPKGGTMAIQEGKRAPAFTLPDQNGNKVALKDFKGKNVILYFYPKDNTSG
jgi:peroxiredoxin